MSHWLLMHSIEPSLWRIECHRCLLRMERLNARNMCLSNHHRSCICHRRKLLLPGRVCHRGLLNMHRLSECNRSPLDHHRGGRL